MRLLNSLCLIALPLCGVILASWEVRAEPAETPFRIRPVTLVQTAEPELGPVDPPPDEIVPQGTMITEDDILPPGKRYGELYRSVASGHDPFNSMTPEQLQTLLERRPADSYTINTGYRDPDIQTNAEHQVKLPANVAQELFAEYPEVDSIYGVQRPWAPSVAMWEAPAFYHRPLYFEEVNLERYGNRHRVVQPAVSAAHFFANTLILPYKIGVNPPCERIYTLGHYRPGDNNPHDRHGLPWSWRGAAYMGTFYTGAAFVLP
ncbi:hypothetical protein M4951_04725 [Blastopirellula sp. J2-11]|uniref:hypothetical protein n=1 Tax=Blastopirellula sp. J2-11 TaxID=2943192 RepID=UPI0021C6D74F|nr:hypothetical protein [Blastopirellula sp. J2-11]UUO07613.1 hypothetical protein M4951_04725 [Blastopirellula sp. J2-11]